MSAEYIPEDIRQKAAEIAIQLDGPYSNRIHGLYDQRTFDIIARAIMEERERCAVIANICDGQDGDGGNVGYHAYVGIKSGMLPEQFDAIAYPDFKALMEKIPRP